MRYRIYYTPKYAISHRLFKNICDIVHDIACDIAWISLTPLLPSAIAFLNIRYRTKICDKITIACDIVYDIAPRTPCCHAISHAISHEMRYRIRYRIRYHIRYRKDAISHTMSRGIFYFIACDIAKMRYHMRCRMR